VYWNAAVLGTNHASANASRRLVTVAASPLKIARAEGNGAGIVPSPNAKQPLSNRISAIPARSVCHHFVSVRAGSRAMIVPGRRSASLLHLAVHSFRVGPYGGFKNVIPPFGQGSDKPSSAAVNLILARTGHLCGGLPHRQENRPRWLGKGVPEAVEGWSTFHPTTWRLCSSRTTPGRR
jgi:hypothetical protein